MTQAEKDEVYGIIYRLAVDLFYKRCFVCHKEIEGTSGKGYTIHHIDYVEGELDYTDFKKNEKLTDAERLQYWQYMEPIIRAEPWRFALVDNWHHVQIGRLRRFKDNHVIMRLFLLVLITQYTPPRSRRAKTRLPKV